MIIVWTLYGELRSLPNVCVTNNLKYVLFVSHNTILSSLMTYHQVCNKSNTTGNIMWSRSCLPFQSFSIYDVTNNFLKRVQPFFLAFDIELQVNNAFFKFGLNWSQKLHLILPVALKLTEIKMYTMY